MFSSLVGIGAALSALVWVGVLWFIVSAWVDDQRRGFREPPLDPARRDKRRAESTPRIGNVADIDLTNVDGIDLTAPPPDGSRVSSI